MLNKQQFLQKHKEKFSKLTAKEIDKRYRDYQLSKAMRSNDNGERISKLKKAGPGEKSYATMSQCSKTYAHALLDPWSLQVPPCVPDNITLPSYKFCARQRGGFVVGTAGVGFISVDPYLFGTDADNAILFTDSAYASNQYTDAGIGVNLTSSDSTFDLASFDPATQAARSLRIVGFGIRVRYTGSEITRSGQCIAFRQPENRMIVAPSTMPALLANREAVTVPADRKWHLCLWKPASPRDLGYYDDFADFSTTEWSQLIVVNGAEPGTSFEVDLIGWYEVIGNSLPFLSRSHSDPLGLSVVSAALSEKQPTGSNPVATFIRDATAIANESLSFIQAMSPVIGAISSFI